MYRIRKDSLIKTIVIFILIIPYLAPTGITNLSPLFGTIIWGAYTRIAFFIIIILLTFSRYINHIRLPKSCTILISFFIVLALITLLKGRSLNPWFQYYFNSICLLLIYGTFKNDIVEFMHAIIGYLSVLCLINFLLVLAYPNGMYVDYTAGFYANWLLGYKSSLQYYVIPLVVYLSVDSKYSGRKAFFFIINALCVFESLLCGNVMLFIVLLVFDFFYFTKMYMAPKLGIRIYLIVAAVINVLLIFFVNFVFNSVIGTLLQNVFNKTVTLSSRANIIWPKAIQIIMKSPFTGYGVISTSEYRSIFGINSAPHAHNQILNYLIEGGILYLVIFVLVLLFIMRKVEPRSDEASKCYLLGMFVILILLAVEVLTSHIGGGFWLIFAMLMDSDYIDLRYLDYYSYKFNKKLNN